MEYTMAVVFSVGFGMWALVHYDRTARIVALIGSIGWAITAWCYA